ncbi:MAG: DUF1552 domain-containing protein [Polyangiaceae bacterium]|nr:DUF1552 domain-containing protein [Polyangiaceae bacterium]
MSIKRFGRRLFLGGAGAVVALPVLESALPKLARAEGVAKRFLAFYVPNGIHMANWTPTTQGAGYELSPILSPLGNLKDKTLVLTGLANKPAQPDGPGDHASGTGAFLTARHPFKTEGANIQNGISLDQQAAKTIGPLTRIPSMQLGIDGGDSAGDCDSGYSCAYARNISWASESQPLPKVVNPAVVYDQLFGGFDPEATAAETAKRKKYRTSVLDYVTGEAQSLSLKLGASDRAKLDEYLTGVYELGKKIEKLGTGPVCTQIDTPPSKPPLTEHVALMSDLMVLAMQCDATRIVTFMLANAGSGRSYDFIGVSGAHHEISHHQDIPENFDKLTQIDTWEVSQLAYLLGKMDAIDEGGVTMLDNSLVFFSSEIEDGNSHAHRNMPILLAGTGGGKIASGRHLVFNDDRPVADLFLSILNALDLPDTSFGQDSTGPIVELYG